jgi:radical SAM superfamily enzyme YgiQ (UPF0313 family)
MRILLVNPPVPDINAIRDHRVQRYGALEGMELNKREMIGPPLALNDIAGVLRDEEVRIVDQKFENDETPNYDFEQAIHDEVKNFGPDIVGITCLTAHVNSARKILKIVRDYDPKILTVVGGLHTTLNPQDFCMPEVDLVVIGLGKRAMREIVDAFKISARDPNFSNISGLGIRVDGKLKFTRQFSEFSRKELRDEQYLYYDSDEYFPDRDLTDRYNYIIEERNLKVHYMNTSLGCTDKCSFCGLWKFACGYYIPRDISTIIREIKTMDAYPVVRMVDSHTFGDIGHAKLMFETLIQENIGHGYIVDVRTDTVVKHPSIFSLAAKAGVKVAILGFEATTDEELEKYNKNSTIANTIQAIDTLHDAGIWCAGNYIIGPHYDERDFDRVAEFITKHPILFAGFTVMTPYPGTPQYEQMKDQIVIKNLDYYNLVNAVVKTNLPEDVFYNKIVDLYKLSKKARDKFMKKAGINMAKEKIKTVIRKKK